MTTQEITVRISKTIQEQQYEPITAEVIIKESCPKKKYEERTSELLALASDEVFGYLGVEQDQPEAEGDPEEVEGQEEYEEGYEEGSEEAEGSEEYGEGEGQEDQEDPGEFEDDPGGGDEFQDFFEDDPNPEE
jgi:hypothetical protein